MIVMLERLNGYKTLIGGVLHAAWFIYYLFVDKSIDTETKWTGHGIIGILTGVGLTHKIYKNKEAISNNIKKVSHGRKSI